MPFRGPIRAAHAILRLGFVAAVIVGATSSLRATSVIPPSFEELVAQSDYVVRAVVKSVAFEERARPGGSKMIFSKVELEVRQVITGTPPSPLVLEVLGGVLNGKEIAIEGAPKFRVGDESILFVQGNGRQIYPLVRMMHGLYRLEKDAASGREYVTRSNGEPLADVGRVAEPIEATGPASTQRAQAITSALSPDDFVAKIRAAASQAAQSHVRQ